MTFTGHVNEDGESGMVKSNSHSDLSQDSMGKIKGKFECPCLCDRGQHFYAGLN